MPSYNQKKSFQKTYHTYSLETLVVGAIKLVLLCLVLLRESDCFATVVVGRYFFESFQYERKKSPELF